MMEKIVKGELGQCNKEIVKRKKRVMFAFSFMQGLDVSLTCKPSLKKFNFILSPNVVISIVSGAVSHSEPGGLGFEMASHCQWH